MMVFTRYTPPLSDHSEVTVTVQVALLPPADAVITLEPVATPVTRPVLETVALPGVPLT